MTSRIISTNRLSTDASMKSLRTRTPPSTTARKTQRSMQRAGLAGRRPPSR